MKMKYMDVYGRKVVGLWVCLCTLVLSSQRVLATYSLLADSSSAINDGGIVEQGGAGLANVGGSTPQFSMGGGSKIVGNLDAAGTFNQNNMQNGAPFFNNATITGGAHQNVAGVNSEYNQVWSQWNYLSTVTGTSLAINTSSGSQTISGAGGTYNATENAYVYNAISLNFNSGTTLNITGPASETVIIKLSLQNMEMMGSITSTPHTVFELYGSGEWQNSSSSQQQASYAGFNLSDWDLAGQVDSAAIYANSLNIDSSGVITGTGSYDLIDEVVPEYTPTPMEYTSVAIIGLLGLTFWPKKKRP